MHISSVRLRLVTFGPRFFFFHLVVLILYANTKNDKFYTALAVKPGIPKCLEFNHELNLSESTKLLSRCWDYINYQLWKSSDFFISFDFSFTRSGNTCRDLRSIANSWYGLAKNRRGRLIRPIEFSCRMPFFLCHWKCRNKMAFAVVVIVAPN